MDVEQGEIKEPKEGSEDPDNANVDESEDDGPEESERDGQECSDQSVEPEFGRREDEEREAPDEFESMVWVRFPDHIIEVDVDVSVDLLVIPVQDIESDGEVLGADQRILSLLLLFGFLHFFLLFLLSSGLQNTRKREFC